MVLCVVLIATFFIVFASLIHRASERNNIGWETQRSLPSSFPHPLARVSGITIPSLLYRRTPFRMIPACLARLFGKLTGFALSLVPDSLRARTHIGGIADCGEICPNAPTTRKSDHLQRSLLCDASMLCSRSHFATSVRTCTVIP